MIFLSFVHRTTSHGADGLSESPVFLKRVLVSDDCREWRFRTPGEPAREEAKDLGDGERRDKKRRSNGLSDELGLCRWPDAGEAYVLLLGEIGKVSYEVGQPVCAGPQAISKASRVWMEDHLE